MKNQHTKGEWQSFIQPHENGLIKTINVGSKRIADLKIMPTIEESEGNAEMICKAVNAHESLMDALRDANKFIHNVLNERSKTKTGKRRKIDSQMFSDLLLTAKIGTALHNAE